MAIYIYADTVISRVSNIDTSQELSTNNCHSTGTPFRWVLFGREIAETPIMINELFSDVTI